ncbi:MAG: 4Fe-4S binding protein [Gemmataceae bacterium]|nr:4Fe-4S binding protein [Gemmataceae bacterium]
MAARSQPLLRRVWQQRELPVLDDRLCTGCERCVGVCPTECLALDGHRPWLPRPEHCVSCAACVVICPSAALALARLPSEA